MSARSKKSHKYKVINTPKSAPVSARSNALKSIRVDLDKKSSQGSTSGDGASGLSGMLNKSKAPSEKKKVLDSFVKSKLVKQDEKKKEDKDDDLHGLGPVSKKGDDTDSNASDEDDEFEGSQDEKEELLESFSSEEDDEDEGAGPQGLSSLVNSHLKKKNLQKRVNRWSVVKAEPGQQGKQQREEYEFRLKEKIASKLKKQRDFFEARLGALKSAANQLMTENDDLLVEVNTLKKKLGDADEDKMAMGFDHAQRVLAAQAAKIQKEQRDQLMSGIALMHKMHGKDVHAEQDEREHQSNKCLECWARFQIYALQKFPLNSKIVKLASRFGASPRTFFKLEQFFVMIQLLLFLVWVWPILYHLVQFDGEWNVMSAPLLSKFMLWSVFDPGYMVYTATVGISTFVVVVACTLLLITSYRVKGGEHSSLEEKNSLRAVFNFWDHTLSTEIERNEKTKRLEEWYRSMVFEVFSDERSKSREKKEKMRIWCRRFWSVTLNIAIVAIGSALIITTISNWKPELLLRAGNNVTLVVMVHMMPGFITSVLNLVQFDITTRLIKFEKYSKATQAAKMQLWRLFFGRLSYVIVNIVTYYWIGAQSPKLFKYWENPQKRKSAREYGAVDPEERPYADDDFLDCSADAAGAGLLYLIINEFVVTKFAVILAFLGKAAARSLFFHKPKEKDDKEDAKNDKDKGGGDEDFGEGGGKKKETLKARRRRLKKEQKDKELAEVKASLGIAGGGTHDDPKDKRAQKKELEAKLSMAHPWLHPKEFNPADEAVACLCFQTMLWATMPLAPVAIVWGTFMTVINFHWDALKIRMFYKKPSLQSQEIQSVTLQNLPKFLWLIMAISCGAAVYFTNSEWVCEVESLGPFRELKYDPQGKQLGSSHHIPFFSIQEWFDNNVYNGLTVYEGLSSAATYLALSVIFFTLYAVANRQKKRTQHLLKREKKVMEQYSIRMERLMAKKDKLIEAQMFSS